ncbi:MAG: hypothetical protein PHY04_02360 [Candidatus ainarchaeum sp.]|jgi:hypothetical protein|nr:hypothetical protein [Candidatus ainarchaeum sp.]MDD3085720.1 hypothetical protein [Candidatus ainarchaeum sp.]MDD4128556.1 hypothetical protein [Candidatus ainarchaeum sp.]MDD4467822.1 hypothetical protein [Candidatus ainarchaeum sp.]HPM85564.1 hypothetical protein [archaeon]
MTKIKVVMMGIIDTIKQILGIKQKTNPKPTQNQEVSNNKKEFEVRSIWDFLQFNEHTQAFHLASVIRFDEWVTMDEVRRRIFDLFQVDYENERSLYPYLKTMVDVGLIESNNIGGKRKWRKKDLLIKLEKKKKEEEKEKEIEKEALIQA